MPSCRRRGGGREDESGLVVEGGEGDTREEMEEEIRPTGQMDTIRSYIKTTCKWITSQQYDDNSLTAKSTRAWTMTPTTTRSWSTRCGTRVTSLCSSRSALPL